MCYFYHLIIELQTLLLTFIMTVRGVTNKQYNQQQLDEQNGYLKGVTIMRWTRNVPVLSRSPNYNFTSKRKARSLFQRRVWW